jgi:hypothetical protein
VTSLARFGVVLLPESLAGFGALCRQAEENGFELLGVADSQSVFRDFMCRWMREVAPAGRRHVSA